MQQNQAIKGDAESPVDVADIERMLNDDNVTDEAKEMMRKAVAANKWHIVKRLLGSGAMLPEWED